MYTDYHCHMLPQMDDGAKTIDIALQMIHLAYKQNVRSIVFTPHFYSFEEDIPSFLQRRDSSYELLKEHINELKDIEFHLGAEVYLTKKISKKTDLHKLCYGNSNYILIEMPYNSIENWMIDEIEEITYNHSVIPVFAHIDRYFSIYGKKELEFLFSMEDAIFQINNESLLHKKSLKQIEKMIQRDISIIFGSDSHNLTSRAPNFNIISESKEIFYNNNSAIYIEN